VRQQAGSGLVDAGGEGGFAHFVILFQG
jgi:hypothetical protein